MNKNNLISVLEELSIGLRRFTVQHEHYSEQWAEAFKLVSAEISPLLGDAQVYHIGSTAIPGCIAKPILDIGIGYHQGADFAQQTQSLVELGFTSKGAYGVEGRSFFTFYNDEETFDYIHIHAYKEQDPKLLAHIAFRDAHLADASLVEKYNELKIDLVSRGVSRQDYPAAKTAYITEVLDNPFA